MNNKLFARIMTAVICICMMSTVVFAAETGAAPSLDAVEGDATTMTLNFMDGTTNIIAPATTADQVTMMAYLVDDETPYADAAYVDEATTPMLAIDQYDGDAIAETVSVLASKIVEGMKVVVQTGDSNEGGDKWIIAQEVVEDEVIITFMNGDTANPVVAADGKVTLPTAAETAFWGKPASGLTFTLYSWVALDAAGAVVAEYKVADTTEIDAPANITLYAKYDTGYKIGMINADAVINGTDTTMLNLYTLRGTKNALNANVNSPIYEGSSIIVGAINNDTVVNGTDTTMLNLFTLRGTKNALNANIGKKVYVVHKTDVLVEE